MKIFDRPKRRKNPFMKVTSFREDMENEFSNIEK